jgi:hypothetical protein
MYYEDYIPQIYQKIPKYSFYFFSLLLLAQLLSYFAKFWKYSFYFGYYLQFLKRRLIPRIYVSGGLKYCNFCLEKNDKLITAGRESLGRNTKGRMKKSGTQKAEWYKRRRNKGRKVRKAEKYIFFITTTMNASRNHSK